MMIKWILSACLLAGLGFSEEPVLLKRLEKAQSGDFIVFEANKTITLLVIRSASEKSLILEEISANLPKPPDCWAGWLLSKAPGHTSWSMIEIDLKEREILESYSFSKAAWISHSPSDSFLGTLIHLPLRPLAKDKYRRIGSPPPEGEPDRRQIWNPPFFAEGRKVEGATFAAYETEWPQDGSELSGKSIILYFDREGESPLPCWIQIDTGHVMAALRAIDSGKRLPASAYRTLPRRIPEFLGVPTKTTDGKLRFQVKSPKYYKQFDLFAVDVTHAEKKIHLLEHSKISGEGERITLEVEPQELNEQLEPNHQYTWIIMPLGRSSSYNELSKPFTWR